MITAADADASPEICARRRAFPSPDEVVNGVEADQSHDDQIDRHDGRQRAGSVRADGPDVARSSGVTYARSVLAGLYRLALVGLVTPMRDGMNLVAKEYVAAQDPTDPGVLILSKFAGAAQQLTGALIVNPNDKLEVAEAIRDALQMSHEERVTRWQGMIGPLQDHDVSWWAAAFLGELAAQPAATDRRRPRARRSGG